MKKFRFRNLIAGFSFATAFFIFQACYGAPQDFGLDVLIEGKVVSEKTGEAIPGIKVSTADNTQFFYTDTDGIFSFYTGKEYSYTLNFNDADGEENGSYMPLDTVFQNEDATIFLNIKMQEAK